VTTSLHKLPPGFETLEPFVDRWSLPTADQRLKRRIATTEAERLTFHAAVCDLLDDGLDYLDKKLFTEYDDADQRLMQLLLSFAHISLAVEVQGDDEPEHAAAARFITISRAPSEG